MNRQLRISNPFNDAAMLEVEFAPNKWARVTSNHFRSYTGNRRINGEHYKGPIYYQGTNTRYKTKPNDVIRIVSIEELNGKKATKKQPQIIRFYDRDAKYR